MLEGLLGAFGVDKEDITFKTIQKTLKNLSEELNCSYKELFIMILPCKEDFSMKFYVYQITPTERKYIRDISLKEVLGIEEDKKKK